MRPLLSVTAHQFAAPSLEVLTGTLPPGCSRSFSWKELHFASHYFTTIVLAVSLCRVAVKACSVGSMLA